jgi:hypothetical protein
MHRSLPRLTRALAAVAGVAAVASCSGDSTGTNGNVKDYFSAVQAVVTTAGTAAAPSAAFRPAVGAKSKANRPLFSLSMPPVTVNATFHSGTARTGSSGPGVTDAAGVSTPLLGQPFRYSLAGSGTFSKVYIWVDGVDGYWELDLPISVQTLDLVLQLTENAGASFDLETALGSSGGNGAAHGTTITTTDLANADVAVTVKWTGASDVDLHVIDGKGQEVFYASPETAEGGALDLDSNAGCDIDNVNQETISWPQDHAPSGTYTIKVDYYADCGVPSSTYNGTYQVKGQGTKSFGPFTFTGLSGTNNPEKTVGTFTLP